MATRINSMPQNVARRIMKHAAESDEEVVLTFRQGKPSRVFGHKEYDKMVQLPHRVKPWEHRKKKEGTPDPLGAVDAEPPVGLSRRKLYDEE